MPTLTPSVRSSRSNSSAVMRCSTPHVCAAGSGTTFATPRSPGPTGSSKESRQPSSRPQRDSVGHMRRRSQKIARLMLLPYAKYQTGSSGTSAPPPHGSTLLDERTLRLARVVGPPERRADLLLPTVRLGEREMDDLAHAAARGADRERRVRRDRISGRERRRQKIRARDDAVDEPDRERARGVDRLRGEEQH